MSADIDPDQQHDDIMYPQVLPFLLVHAGAWRRSGRASHGKRLQFAFFRPGCACLRWTAGYHRYFSHRAYSTSRTFQFILAFLAQSSAQKSVLWWAAKHRHHHLHRTPEQDVHSPRHRGLVYSHVSWIFYRYMMQPIWRASDFASYPELMWLHRFEVLPAVVVGGLCLLIAGWPGLVLGFLWSTVFVYHATFCINPSHMFMDASGMLRVMTSATIGCWLCSRWAKVGTTIITPTKAARSKAFAGGRSMRPIMSGWSVWFGLSWV